VPDVRLYWFEKRQETKSNGTRVCQTARTCLFFSANWFTILSDDALTCSTRINARQYLAAKQLSTLPLNQPWCIRTWQVRSLRRHTSKHIPALQALSPSVDVLSRAPLAFAQSEVGQFAIAPFPVRTLAYDDWWLRPVAERCSVPYRRAVLEVPGVEGKRCVTEGAEDAEKYRMKHEF